LARLHATRICRNVCHPAASSPNSTIVNFVPRGGDGIVTVKPTVAGTRRPPPFFCRLYSFSFLVFQPSRPFVVHPFHVAIRCAAAVNTSFLLFCATEPCRSLARRVWQLRDSSSGPCAEPTVHCFMSVARPIFRSATPSRGYPRVNVFLASVVRADSAHCSRSVLCRSWHTQIVVVAVRATTFIIFVFVRPLYAVRSAVFTRLAVRPLFSPRESVGSFVCASHLRRVCHRSVCMKTAISSSRPSIVYRRTTSTKPRDRCLLDAV